MKYLLIIALCFSSIAHDLKVEDVVIQEVEPQELKPQQLKPKLRIRTLVGDSRMERAGDEVGNGGGLYENRLANTFLQLEDYINSALYFENFSPDELDVLLAIKRNYKNILDNTDLFFQSEDEFFSINGNPRLAMTGSKIGDPIVFNLDKLYDISPEVLKETLITIIIHEAGHLVGYEDHQFLDAIGAKVSRAANANRSIFYFNFADSSKYIETFNFSEIGISSHINLVYNDSVIDLEPYFNRVSGCNSENHYYNLHKNFRTNEVEGSLVYKCDPDSDFSEVPFVLKINEGHDQDEDKEFLNIERIFFK